MYRKPGSGLIVLMMLAMACGDTGDDGGEVTQPPATNEQAQSGTTAADQPGTTASEESSPTTEAPADTTADTTEAGDQTTTAAANQEETGTTTTRGSAEDLTPSETTPTVVGSDPGDDGEADPGAPLTELPTAKVSRAFEPLVDQAVQDLVSRIGVDPADIGVALAEFVVWPDGAVGCPQPGMVYTQVQVDGARVVLTHGANSYAYHVGGSASAPFLCENPA